MTTATCATCRHFQPAPDNPTAGMGGCACGHGHWFPGEAHRCGDHKAEKQEDEE